MLTRRREFLPWVRLVLSILTLVATGFLSIANELKPAPSVALLGGTTIALVLISAVLPSVNDFRFGQALRVESYITSELRAAFAFMVETAGFSPLRLRLHFFRIRWTWRWRGWPIKGRQWRWRGFPIKKALVRAGFFSIKTDSGLSDVTWPEGVGVVGAVWKNRNISGIAVNVGFGSLPTPEQWVKLPANARFNMDYELLARMHKLEAVFAVAVLAEQEQGKVVAVLSADTTVDDLAKFDAAGVRAFLRRTAWGAWQSRLIRGK